MNKWAIRIKIKPQDPDRPIPTWIHCRKCGFSAKPDCFIDVDRARHAHLRCPRCQSENIHPSAIKSARWDGHRLKS